MVKKNCGASINNSTGTFRHGHVAGTTSGVHFSAVEMVRGGYASSLLQRVESDGASDDRE